MDHLSLGVIAVSRRENEFRLPIHPLHFGRIAADLRARIYLERGYGERFGGQAQAVAEGFADADRELGLGAELPRVGADGQAAVEECGDQVGFGPARAADDGSV